MKNKYLYLRYFQIKISKFNMLFQLISNSYTKWSNNKQYDINIKKKNDARISESNQQENFQRKRYQVTPISVTNGRGIPRNEDIHVVK